MIKHKKTTLKNGLRIITVPMKETQTVTVMVMVGVGSRYEAEKEAGLSHFIEHMFFKGTKKRPTSLDISEELDAIGGEFNAFTSKDRTMYFAKADAKHIDTALDVVADMYLNSKIEEREIKKEKGTIIQELNMYEDTPVRNVGDIFEKLLYPNPLGREIIGCKRTIKSLKRKDFIGYMERFYRANDSVICVAGKFNEKKIIDRITGYFGRMKSGEKPSIIKINYSQVDPEVKIKYKKTDQTHFVIGNRAYDYNHKDRFALALLSVILGGSMSSRLFIEVREKRGLAYYVKTGIEAYEDVGYIATQAGVEHKNLELSIKTILSEYRKISKNKILKKELQKAKDYIKGKAIMGMEASDEVAMFFIDQEVMRGDIMTLQEKFKIIEKVSEDDIMRIAKDVFQNNKLNLAVIGPHKNKKKLMKLLKL
jgi:predicted Zn-dependent peptidase